MCNFTKEEKKLIQDVLLNTPLQGTVQTLPASMQKILDIVKKLEEPNELNSDEQEG